MPPMPYLTHHLAVHGCQLTSLLRPQSSEDWTQFCGHPVHIRPLLPEPPPIYH